MSIYVDYAATTPVDKEILKSMLDNADKFGNPSSIHRIGKEGKAFYEKSRKNAAELIEAKPDEIVFTGSATEANNMVIRGIVSYYERPHIITTSVEHASVKETYQAMEDYADVTYLDVTDKSVLKILKML